METINDKEISSLQKQKVLKKRAELLQITEEKTQHHGKQIDGLVFMLSNEKYAIDSTLVSEVIQVSDITPLPCTPAFILGIINIRGKILSVIDIKKFLNLPGKEGANLNKVIIVNCNNIELGILTDEIIGSTKIFLETLQKKLSTITEDKENYIVGVSTKRLIVLDIKGLLQNDKIVINEQVII